MPERPKAHLAVLTCMDARIDIFAVLGLKLGDAYVLRNAGGRVNEDVTRSLALACHSLDVTRLLILQHTQCGLFGVTEEQLRAHTGADLTFLTISDHNEALRADVEKLAAIEYLTPLQEIDGAIYDLDRGTVETVIHWER